MLNSTTFNTADIQQNSKRVADHIDTNRGNWITNTDYDKI